jgi:DNA-binding NarL/FixJ family response regulator
METTMPHRASAAASGAVLVVDALSRWPAELLDGIARAGHVVVPIDDVKLVPFFVLAGGVTAVLVRARKLGMTELLALRTCRRRAPRTRIVIAAAAPTHADLKRALDSGADTLLDWPAAPDVVLRAIRGGVPLP